MVWRSARARNIYTSTGNNVGLTSEESSEAEFVEEEKPWPPKEERLSRARARLQKQASRLPRPHSHLYTLGGKPRGGKHARRWENCE